ncbi:MAG TPA: hypothetical protein VM598_08405, partial [Bdellovibrionota bacterium]|nr:hypothetical protein [Bdellovibrionota bacterium]
NGGDQMRIPTVKQRILETSIILAGVAALLVFVSALVFGRLEPGHQAIFYDSAVYFQGARDFFLAPSQSSLLRQERPVFAWPLLLFYRLIGADPTIDQLFLHNLLLGLAGVLGAMIWTARIAMPGAAARTALWTALCAFALFCSFSPVPRAGAHFTGDVLSVAACLGLAACAMSWLARPRPGFGVSAALAALFAYGINVKIVFIPWALAWMALLWGFSARAGRPRIIAVTAAASFLAWVSWPSGLWSFIERTYFANEVLDDFVRQSTLLESLLWYPIELHRNLPSVQLAFLVSLVAYLAVVAVRDRKRFLESARPLGALWVTWFLAVAVVGVFVRSKEARTFLFLFPAFFILAILTAARASDRRRGERVGLAIGALVGLVASIAHLHRPFIGMPFETIESSGALGIHSAIQRDANSSTGLVTLSLLQKAGVLNPVTFNYLPSALGTLGAPVSMRPALAAHDQTARYGMFGVPGGIPLGFFRSNYILHCPVPGSQCMSGNPATQRISARLSENDTTFMEGLTRVARIATPYGPVEILRRDRMPRARTFVRIVNELLATDELNLWNYPFVLAASRLDSSGALKSAEAAFREAIRSRPMPRYFLQARGLEWARAFLAGDQRALGQISYPRFFERQEPGR